MKKTMLKLTMVGLVASCVFGLIMFRIARATPPTGVTNTLIAGPVAFDEIRAMSQTPTHGALIMTRGFSDVYITRVKIAPGGDTGWHSHPGVALVSVISGNATEYDGDDCDAAPIVHYAGTGLEEEAGHVHIVRNEGDTDLEMVVVFLVPFGAKTRIDESAPDCSR